MRAALLGLGASAAFASAATGCSGKVDQGQAAGGRSGATLGGSRNVAGSSGGGLVSSGGVGGVAPYQPGPHGGPNQPCYPNGSCDLGLLCSGSFTCVFDPNASAGFGNGGTSFAGFGTGGTSSAGFGAEPSAAGAGPPPTPFCDPNAVPVQPREPLPFTVTSAFIGSGWFGNPSAIGYSPCVGERAPGAFGFCDRWSYLPQAVPDPYVGVAYVRMWDTNYTHPPVCLAEGAEFVDFYAKGALGGEAIVAAAAGGGEFYFTLTTEWQRYRIPLGPDYDAGPSGIELGFQWELIAADANTPIPATTFQVDSIRWVRDVGGAAGEAGAGGDGAGGEAGEAGAGGAW